MSQLAAGRRQFDELTSTVRGIAYPSYGIELLKLVEHVDDHAGGHADGLGQFQLRQGPAGQEFQDGAVPGAQPEGGQPTCEPHVHLLAQLAQQETDRVGQRLFRCHIANVSLGI